MAFGMEAVEANVDTNTFGTVSKRKNISQEGIDKIIYDIMSSDKGLASLGSLENASGGYGASDKTLMAQDLMTKLAGEIALITAEETTTTDMTQDKMSPLNEFFGEPQSLGDTSVICTELVRQGLLDKELYHGGQEHFNKLSRTTVQGYQFWGKPIAARMRTSKLLTAIMLPVAQARYGQIVNGKRSFLGSLTIYFGQPACFVIGLLLSAVRKLKESFHGNKSEQSA